MPVIQDKYGRTFRTLRVSLLNHCNLGCVYCVAGEEDIRRHNADGKEGILSVPDILAIVGRLQGQLGLATVRLTGGEPLLYPGLPELVHGIRAMGITDIRLTTNGFLLERLARPLREAGIRSVNVSLDAIDEDLFFQMSRRHSAGRVIRGIDAAIGEGMEVKVNSVVMKGMNDSQVIPLLEFAGTRNIRNRYLEVMAMGHLHDRPERYLVTQEEILDRIRDRYDVTFLGRKGAATAGYWKTSAGHVFGIIANESEPFCRDCDRLRLDSKGHIYGCLSSNRPIVLDPGATELEWREQLQRALEQKQPLRFTGSDLSMLDIGG